MINQQEVKILAAFNVTMMTLVEAVKSAPRETALQALGGAMG
jgi:hypothetical protein